MTARGRPGLGSSVLLPALPLAIPLLALACGTASELESAGEKPLIVSDRGGAVRVYEIDLDASLARLIGSSRADDAAYQDGMPCRLPDGRVVFASDRGGAFHLYMASADGATASPLLISSASPPTPASPATPGVPVPGVPDSEETDPSPFAPGRILFARGPQGKPRDLFAAALDGSGLRQLTRHPGDDGAPCAAADGRTVVFTSDRDGASRLYRLDAGAPDPEASVAPLSPPPSDGIVVSAPACLVDGSTAFGISSQGGPRQIFVVGPAGAARGLRQITDALVLPFGAGEPVPLLDGWLLFTAGPTPGGKDGKSGRYAVYRITQGGYNLKRVTRDGAGYSDFARRLRPPP